MEMFHCFIWSATDLLFKSIQKSRWIYSTQQIIIYTCKLHTHNLKQTRYTIWYNVIIKYIEIFYACGWFNMRLDFSNNSANNCRSQPYCDSSIVRAVHTDNISGQTAGWRLVNINLWYSMILISEFNELSDFALPERHCAHALVSITYYII